MTLNIDLTSLKYGSCHHYVYTFHCSFLYNRYVIIIIMFGVAPLLLTMYSHPVFSLTID